MKQELWIFYDLSSSGFKSFKEVLDYKGQRKRIQTNCLVFFSFDYLEKFEDVIICSEFGCISLKGLLKGDHTIKQIRREHNALKLFMARALEWK